MVAVFPETTIPIPPTVSAREYGRYANRERWRRAFEKLEQFTTKELADYLHVEPRNTLHATNYGKAQKLIKSIKPGRHTLASMEWEYIG